MDPFSSQRRRTLPPPRAPVRSDRGQTGPGDSPAAESSITGTGRSSASRGTPEPAPRSSRGSRGSGSSIWGRQSRGRGSARDAGSEAVAWELARLERRNPKCQRRATSLIASHGTPVLNPLCSSITHSSPSPSIVPVSTMGSAPPTTAVRRASIPRPLETTYRL